MRWSSRERDAQPGSLGNIEEPDSGWSLSISPGTAGPFVLLGQRVARRLRREVILEIRNEGVARARGSSPAHTLGLDRLHRRRPSIPPFQRGTAGVRPHTRGRGHPGPSCAIPRRRVGLPLEATHRPRKVDRRRARPSTSGPATGVGRTRPIPPARGSGTAGTYGEAVASKTMVTHVRALSAPVVVGAIAFAIGVVGSACGTDPAAVTTGATGVTGELSICPDGSDGVALDLSGVGDGAPTPEDAIAAGTSFPDGTPTARLPARRYPSGHDQLR